MGLYDRDYVRDDEESQYQNFLSTQSITTLLVIVNVAFYLADMIFAGETHWLTKSMMVSAETLTHPLEWWQFLSAGFAHDWNNMWHLIGNMFGLWMFGRFVEEKVGRYEFLRFYLVTIVLANILFALRQLLFIDPSMWGPALGASGGVTAVIVLFICYYPKQMLLLFFAIPVPAWMVGVFIIVSDLLGALRGKDHVAHDVHLYGAAFAFLYWRFHWRLGRFVPMTWFRSWKKRLSQPKLKVHDPEPTYENIDAEADRLLEKVHRDGEQSLTPRERRILEDYARRMRQKLR
ncbi:MAG TPA: rhomboid family intramembrane serine protease [Pirellulaceae bacterium]|nr:rhomboid family intramembrane serine protease [Pirellulaceae bacterium]